jgi:hypothetical protein
MCGRGVSTQPNLAGRRGGSGGLPPTTRVSARFRSSRAPPTHTTLTPPTHARPGYKKLKRLSLANNQIATNLPEQLFADTPLHDLNLKGNPLNKNTLLEMPGVDQFMKRREVVKRKDLDGGALADLSLCGLD